MPLTTRQEEVMEVLRRPGAYLYAYVNGYIWGGPESWREPVPRKTHGCLALAGLIKRVQHPDLGTAKHEPGMPTWVWVAAPPEPNG